jgi:hypothetical protein
MKIFYSKKNEVDVKSPILLNNQIKNGNGFSKREYHTNNGGGHLINFLPKISKQVYMNKISADNLNKRYYSNDSIEHKKDEKEKDENFYVSGGRVA